MPITRVFVTNRRRTRGVLLRFPAINPWELGAHILCNPPLPWHAGLDRASRAAAAPSYPPVIVAPRRSGTAPGCVRGENIAWMIPYPSLIARPTMACAGVDGFLAVAGCAIAPDRADNPM